MTPDDYAKTADALPDQWIEDIYQREAEVPWILEQLRDARTVCDLGFGSGIVLRALLDAGKSVALVEGAAEFCERARAMQPECAVHHTLFEDYWPVHRFDCVVASHIFEHVADPVALMKRITKWSDRMLVVVPNANSYHRQLAVEMGLMPTVDTITQRDIAVGHPRVYTPRMLSAHLTESGWGCTATQGLYFKPLPNSMLANLPRDLIAAMTRCRVPFKDCANMAVVCEQA